MPMFWEYPGKDGNFWTKDSENVQHEGPEVDPALDDANITVDIMVPGKPVKNMQPFRETVSEFEMFTRAGKDYEQLNKKPVKNKILNV